jgi:hypothetical protein
MMMAPGLRRLRSPTCNDSFPRGFGIRRRVYGAGFSTVDVPLRHSYDLYRVAARLRALARQPGHALIRRRTRHFARLRLLFPPRLHPCEHLSLRLQPLVRVVLQHSPREVPGDCFDNVLGFSRLEQVRHHRMPEIVKTEPR